MTHEGLLPPSFFFRCQKAVATGDNGNVAKLLNWRTMCEVCSLFRPAGDGGERGFVSAVCARASRHVIVDLCVGAWGDPATLLILRLVSGGQCDMVKNGTDCILAPHFGVMVG